MPPCPRSLSRQRGAALLLLTVMAGMGAAALLMNLFKPASDDSAHQQRTQRQLAEAREALLGYAAQYGRLPRPAISPLNGTEKQQACDTADSCNGFIPWVTLGINGVDSWGKLLRYSVTPAFTEAPIRPVTAGDKSVSGRDNDGKPFYLAGRDACPVYAQCPPAVIYSSGRNNLGTSMQGVRLANSTESNIDERQNEIATMHFISRPPTNLPDAPGGEFDDQVIWIPVQLLNLRLRAAPLL